VQRIGYDSFTPDSGVLLARNKVKPDNSCGYGCFTWVIDARPEDVRAVDFVRPDGTTVMRTVADYRQLNDALFHAGLDSGSQYEWEDAPNRLHFYVIDLQRSEAGILSYTVGVRSLDGPGPQARGVALTAPRSPGAGAEPVAFTAPRAPKAGLEPVVFTLRNTGAASTIDVSAHPRDLTPYAGYDIYRLSVAVDGKGWSAGLQNALVAVRFGESASVPVFVARGEGSAATARVTLRAHSESEPARAAAATCDVRADSRR